MTNILIVTTPIDFSTWAPHRDLVVTANATGLRPRQGLAVGGGSGGGGATRADDASLAVNGGGRGVEVRHCPCEGGEGEVRE
jgi:hypothetical protein